MRHYDCVDCGAECHRKRHCRQPRICIPCAGGRMLAQQTQAHYDGLRRRQQREIAKGGGKVLAYPIETPLVHVSAPQRAAAFIPPIVA